MGLSVECGHSLEDKEVVLEIGGCLEDKVVVWRMGVV